MSRRRDQQHENVLVVGATSGIGAALSRRLARQGDRLVVAGRNLEELQRIAADLRLRHDVEVAAEPFDALDFEGHTAFVDRCFDIVGGELNGVVVCHGYLPESARTEREAEVARRTVDTNFTSVVSLLTPIANRMQERKAGWIAVISSVAGDRGRQSNYVYGSSKAGVSTFLQGLRNRLYHHGVHVLTIKPGFVNTSMVQGRINTESPLVASPEKVAADIEKAIRRRRNQLYTPWFWGAVMWTLRKVPEALFKRLKT